MRGPVGLEEHGRGEDVQGWALALWVILAAVVVVALFPLLHDRTSHGLAILVAASGGAIGGGLGYRWVGRGRSRRGAALAGGLGGALGLLALHVLPLLH